LTLQSNASAPPVVACPQCGTQLGPMMTACPACGRLIYADRLAELAAAARDATARGDLPSALAAWREALPLLPVDSRQRKTIEAKITELGQKLPFHAAPATSAGARQDHAASPASRAAAGVGVIGVTLWKLKALLLGLSKGTTLLSMLLSLGVYWSIWGWRFALGIVLSIYIHEMGHVIALRRYGFKATAPMFIPGLGALIRLQQQVVNPYEDAEIGLAGPIYGLGAALVALLIWYPTRLPIFAAVAGVGAWVNLFNLMPLGTLDGGRGFHAMSRGQRMLACAAVAAAWYATKDGLLILVLLMCVVRALGDRTKGASSWKATLIYIGLIAALSAVSLVRFQAHLQGA
jgi:Zn-dependent protease